MKNILSDDASFHGWMPTMTKIESSNENVSLTHLGGLLLQLSLIQDAIHMVI